MKKSITQDIKKLNSIAKSLNNIKRAFEQNNIYTPKNLMVDEITQAACTQFITNIYEAYDDLRDETKKEIKEINIASIRGARNISSHDYDSVNFETIYHICKKLMRPATLSEIYRILGEFDSGDGEDTE